MAEYIERDVVLEIISRYEQASIRLKGEPIAGAACIAVEVEDIPAADVRPVVRGRWEYNPGDNIPYCSECMMPQDGECNFCPSCGADMRKE